MIYVFYKETGEKIVPHERVIYQDELFAQLPENEKRTYITVEALPEPTLTAGKLAVLCVDTETRTLVYQYQDRLITPEERIAQLEEQLKITQDALDALLLG